MCKGSRMAITTKDAEQGASYIVGEIGVHEEPLRKIGALHAVGSTVEQCVYCIQTGQKITVALSPALQEKLDLPMSSVATFYESEAYHKDDVVDFGRGRRVQFRALKGVAVYIGERTNLSRTVDKLLSEANEPASAINDHLRGVHEPIGQFETL